MESQKITKQLQKINQNLKHLNKAMDFLISRIKYDYQDSDSEQMSPKELVKFNSDFKENIKRYAG